MIIHKLIAHHLKHKDDSGFYRLQAVDAINWIEKSGGKIGSGVKALDLGCGHGIFGAAWLNAVATSRFRMNRIFSHLN